MIDWFHFPPSCRRCARADVLQSSPIGGVFVCCWVGFRVALAREGVFAAAASRLELYRRISSRTGILVLVLRVLLAQVTRVRARPTLLDYMPTTSSWSSAFAATLTSNKLLSKLFHRFRFNNCPVQRSIGRHHDPPPTTLPAPAPSLNQWYSALRGRTLAFVGDSVLRDCYFLMIALLHTSSLSLDPTRTSLHFEFVPSAHAFRETHPGTAGRSGFDNGPVSISRLAFTVRNTSDPSAPPTTLLWCWHSDPRFPQRCLTDERVLSADVHLLHHGSHNRRGRTPIARSYPAVVNASAQGCLNRSRVHAIAIGEATPSAEEGWARSFEADPNVLRLIANTSAARGRTSIWVCCHGSHCARTRCCTHRFTFLTFTLCLCCRWDTRRCTSHGGVESMRTSVPSPTVRGSGDAACAPPRQPMPHLCHARPTTAHAYQSDRVSPSSPPRASP